MRRTFLAIVLAHLLMGIPAMAVDYDKIDRSIAKEPKYSGKPEYALLLFGPEARRRVWVVVDGKTVYVDRNGAGDLTTADEKFAQAGAKRNSPTGSGTRFEKIEELTSSKNSA